MRYKIVLEYFGSNYIGSQKQPSGPTIQEKLEKAVSTLTKENTKVILSGRTDKGVHALNQVAHFDCKTNFHSEAWFLCHVNGLLPDDILIKSIHIVDENFHAQKSAKKRWYRYRVANRRYLSVFENCIIQEVFPLNIDRINQSLKFLEGEHDFSSFKGAKTSNPATVCKMELARCQKQGDVFVFDFVANRFLYKMIRTIVGTVLMLEKKGLPPSGMNRILKAKNRTKSGPTVSPDGLVLMNVIYDEKENIMEAKNENIFS